MVQLNSINADYFNTVKIPKIARFTGTSGQADYVLSTDVRAKNIDLVEAGVLRYLDLQTDVISPLQNTFSFDDNNSTLTLSPAPYTNGLQGIVRYHRIATTTFTSGALTAVPDAPEEYHWTYIPALAAWMAQTQDDMAKAATYEAQYRGAWNTAAENYQKAVQG
ncbi:hypothetical protein [Paenibacillus sp. BIHB 4019]|uniref:phage adaptor protein n=1 Tax=Paenibacillus sp. BIHB 4019 TaxID=1870819 RepID=UPI001F1A3065|nr:hypothetical protein [Paenibacillus sp. BIHB 4019]